MGNTRHESRRADRFSVFFGQLFGRIPSVNIQLCGGWLSFSFPYFSSSLSMPTPVYCRSSLSPQ